MDNKLKNFTDDVIKIAQYYFVSISRIGKDYYKQGSIEVEIIEPWRPKGNSFAQEVEKMNKAKYGYNVIYTDFITLWNKREKDKYKGHLGISKFLIDDESHPVGDKTTGQLSMFK